MMEPAGGPLLGDANWYGARVGLVTDSVRMPCRWARRCVFARAWPAENDAKRGPGGRAGT